MLDNNRGTESQAKISWHKIVILTIFILFAPMGCWIGILLGNIFTSLLLTILLPVTIYILVILIPGIKFFGTREFVVREYRNIFDKIFTNTGEKSWGIFLLPLKGILSTTKQFPLPVRKGKISQHASGTLNYFPVVLFATERALTKEELDSGKFNVQKMDLKDGMIAKVDITASVRIKQKKGSDIKNAIYDLFYVYSDIATRFQNVFNAKLTGIIEIETTKTLKKKKGTDIWKEAFSPEDRRVMKRAVDKMGLELDPISPINFTDLEIDEGKFGEIRKEQLEENVKADILKIRAKAHRDSINKFKGTSEEDRQYYKEIRTIDMLAKKPGDLNLFSPDISAVPTLNMKPDNSQKNSGAEKSSSAKK